MKKLLLGAALAAGVTLVSIAGAQTSISASATSATSTSSTTTSTLTSALVSLSGTASGVSESVRFSGQAQVSARVVTDPDFGGQPAVVLTIDLGNVSGVGTSSGRKYVTTDREILTRKLAAADTVEVNFPFYQAGTSASAAAVGLASINLSFNVSTLKLTGATGAISSPR